MPNPPWVNMVIEMVGDNRPIYDVKKRHMKMCIFKHLELFQRLDPDGYFNTIVTNIGPTAKQSKVLHPWVSFLLCLLVLPHRDHMILV